MALEASQGAATRSGPRRSLGDLASREALLVCLNVVICVTLAVLRPDAFASWTNFKAVLSLMTYDLLLAVAMTTVLIVRGLDLSVGSVFALTSVLLAMMLQDGVPVPVALVLSLAAALACGLVNGLLVTKARLLPFLVTLGTMTVARGIATALSTGQYISFPDAPRWFTAAGRFEIKLSIAGGSYGLPIPFLVVLGLITLYAVALSRWAPLRKAFYVGESPEAARLSGIRVDRVTLSAYVIAAGCVWVAATLITSANKIGYANYGIGSELRALAAAVVGGASTTGGAGSVFGTFLGVLLIALIGNGFILLNGNPDWQQATVGIVLVAAVGIDAIRTYRQGGR